MEWGRKYTKVKTETFSNFFFYLLSLSLCIIIFSLACYSCFNLFSSYFFYLFLFCNSFHRIYWTFCASNEMSVLSQYVKQYLSVYAGVLLVIYIQSVWNIGSLQKHRVSGKGNNRYVIQQDEINMNNFY